MGTGQSRAAYRRVGRGTVRRAASVTGMKLRLVFREGIAIEVAPPMTMTRLVRPVVLLAFLCAAHSVALSQTTVPLTGGDPLDGLDLDPSRVVYAGNVQGVGEVSWRGVTFEPLNYGFGSEPFNATSVEPFAGDQTSSADLEMRSLLQTLGWDAMGGSPLHFYVTGLVPNAAYRLDVLQFAGEWASREQAIVVNGDLKTFVTISQTVAYNTTVAVTSDMAGVIELLLVQSGEYGGTGHQDGAIVNAFIVSTAIPEPSTYALLLGAAGLTLVAWRRRRA